MSILDTIDREEMARLWNEGHSCIEIGHRLSVSETSVRKMRDLMDLPARKPAPQKYTPKIIEDVKRHWVLGLSGTEVARLMGPNWTRGMVLGMVHRYGLGEGRVTRTNPSGSPRPVRVRQQAAAPKPPKVPKPPKAEKPAPAPKPFDLSKSKTDSTAEQRAEKAAAGRLIIAAANDAANDNSVLLMERRFGQCAWPVGQPERPAQQLCCGGPVPADANRSIANYCTGHAQRAVARVLTGGAPDSTKYERAMRRWAA